MTVKIFLSTIKKCLRFFGILIVGINFTRKKILHLHKRKEECCGCTACYAICPKEAISMVEDEEGFEYPQIDDSKCVRCYQCLKVCPFKIINC